MSERSTLRLFVLRVLVVAILATLFGRLWFLQVYAGDGYVEQASANRVREVVEPAPRGEVFDARGAPLVRNRTAFVVSVSRSELLRQDDDGAAVLDRLGTVLGRPSDV
ncbi:MAG: penicillin-binding protein 2, partial [Frankiaceae bacterium]|nr:penicillin-binding protein 2 [Frankiaceae bacterium]